MDYAKQLKKEADTFLGEPLDTFPIQDKFNVLIDPGVTSSSLSDIEENKKGEAALEAMRVHQAEREKKKEEIKSKAPNSKNNDKIGLRFDIKRK